ncbi:conserved hypothetical protein [Methanococcus maripaludis C5]|uniref:Uncharacterized protein n=1 Tax=Methanococcus maripaludis (strain C5 / ATCC BAA-1333) TaxID=402880 RepID=A4FXR6_METM5|nr:hypothetical protein [Methanococcus maripaludis]ABO35000.1 conserved hypothetical protein [Methanococcus maripaludis C5]
MVNFSKNELEVIKNVLKSAESISRDVDPKLFIYSEDMYLGRNDSCRTALYALENEEFLGDFGEEEIEEIIWDELQLYVDYLYNEKSEIQSNDSVESKQIDEIKKLMKKIRPFDE